MDNKYNIGLDIGVASVGWCVTDSNENILKKNGKNLWGARIFNEASTAAERRNFRSARRRLERRKERINILQDLLKEDMDKVNENFFQLLKESSLNFDDKVTSVKVEGKKYNLFYEDGNTDINYFYQYPTIYHLRNYLVNTKYKVDFRLVYLAIHHIIKYRGNFLYEGDFSENSDEIVEKLDNIIDYLNENTTIQLKEDKKVLLDILINKTDRKIDKKEKLIKLFNYDNEDKNKITNIINAILGYVFDLSKVFDSFEEVVKITFSKEIEDEEKLKSNLGDIELKVYEDINAIYSWYILQDILKGKAYISEAMKEKYEKYAKDLKLLKKIYKEYFSDEYNSMFKKYNKNNYVAYVGKSQGKTYKKCKSEDFFNELKKNINKLPNSCEAKEKILKEIDDENFLKKINVTENGEIPHQLHKNELIKIIENQSKYYNTLKNNKEKILQLLTFKIPYYVGPLAKNNSEWAWIIRKSDESIRPWNFDEIVDEDLTAEEFIKRMTNKCTYLLNEDVIPKQSLLYSRFCVLNELNNIKVNAKHISKDSKKKIIDTIFKKKKKINKKMLIDFYKLEGIDVSSVEGLTDNENFMSNMSSYIDMLNIFGKVDESNYEMCEKIIYWTTIFEEKKIIKRKLNKEYPDIEDDIIKKILKLKYIGWSRLSKKLLLGIKSNDGECIMKKLEDSPRNFMQIINDKDFGFMEKIEEMNPIHNKEINYKDIDELQTSPANKRAIWQAINIVKEIEKYMKAKPQKIYIEFARSEENDKKIKDTRTKQLLKKYEDIDKQIKELKDYDRTVYKELKNRQNEKILKEKLYLYLIQNGKCMYSGKTLNIDELDKYEVDHIIPRSFVKDDSFDNKVLVIREENQRKKDSLLLSDKIINDRIVWWKSLLEVGLITNSKYYKLIRRKMFETDNDRDKFVNRQLVETRQIIKNVAEILQNKYSDSKIYTIRGELTHNFRIKYNLYKNRNVNNYHHAQDAYIISVIGNIISKKFISNGEFAYSEYVKKYMKDDKSKNEKNGIILGIINKYVDAPKIKKVMYYKDCYVSNMLEERTGAFYNQTLYSPKEKPAIALKNDKSVLKYGGYSGEQKSYCVIFTYTTAKQTKEYQLIGIPVQTAYDIQNQKETLENYIKINFLKDMEYSNFKILRSKILMNQEYIDENNENMKLCSDSEIRSNKSLIVDEKNARLIYLNNLKDSELTEDLVEELENGYNDLFDYLLLKLENEYKCFNGTLIKIKNNYNKFKELNINEKRNTINGLIDLMSKGQGNLKSIGLTDREGRKSGQKFNTKKLIHMIFIDKSITGIYERKYSVCGLENSCSK